MDWTTAAIATAVVAAWLVLKRAGFIGVEKARALLQQGAPVIDVRSRSEFGAGHLAQAVNVPLDELTAGIAKVVKDKQQPVLLHCLSGGRSAAAKIMLRRLGYLHAHNLGSYRRAARIVNHPA